MSEAELERRAAQLRLPVGLLLAVDAMMRGEKLELRELKAKDIPEIRWLLAEGRPCTDIAMRYAVAVSAVRDVKNGKTWRKIRRKRAPKGLRGPTPRSSRRPKLTPEEVRQMRARFAEGSAPRQLPANSASPIRTRLEFEIGRFGSMSSKMPKELGGRCPLPPRRGLNRAEAAEYIGLGTSKFDMLVADGRMPRPKKVDGRRIWDRMALDFAFEQLDCAGVEGDNPWDD